MPRLVYFAPCLMPIISQEGVLSLINLVERIAVPPTSQDAALPPITAVAYFRREGGDAGKSFELRLRIIGPSGTVLRERVADPFEITDEGHRYLIAIHDFPVAEAGTHGLHLFLREHGVDASWFEVAEYPVDIAHIGTPD